MKSLQIVGDSTYGGGTTLLVHWCQFLLDQGWSVDILATDEKSNVDFQKISGLRVISSIFIPRDISIIKDFRAAVQLFKLIRQEKYDVIHTYTATPGFLGRLIGFLTGTPVILHHQAGWTINEANTLLQKIIFGAMENFAIAISTKSICVSHSTYRQGLTVPFVPKSKLTTICNGIDVDRFDRIPANVAKKSLCEKINGPENTVLIGNASRLAKQKDNESLVRAIGLIKNRQPDLNIRLVMAGDGQDRARLEQIAESLGIKEQIIFLGFCSNVPEFLAGIDIFVSPSLWEGLSISIMEAMAAKKPVIVSSIGPNVELIDDGVTGLVVPVKSPEDIQRAILRFTENPDLAQRCAKAAQEKVMKDYSMDRMFAETLQLYNDLQPRLKKGAALKADAASPVRRWRLISSILIALAVIGLVFGWIGLRIPLANHLLVLRSVLANDQVAQDQAAGLMREQAAADGRANWLLAQVTRDPVDRQAAFRAVLRCCSEYIGLLSEKLSADVALATEATRLYPDRAETWLWLADVLVTAQPQPALAAYTRVVQLNEHNGLAWCTIGRLHERSKAIQQAEAAYLKCCQNEDPGVEGCYGAGRMAELQGNIPRAIANYRLSIWSVAQGRADELERISRLLSARGEMGC